MFWLVDNCSALSACVHGYANKLDMAKMANSVRLALCSLGVRARFDWVTQMADEHYETWGDVMDDVDEVEEGGKGRLRRQLALEKARARFCEEGCLGLDQAAEEEPVADYDDPDAAAYACLHSPRMLAPDQDGVRQEAARP